MRRIKNVIKNVILFFLGLSVVYILTFIVVSGFITIISGRVGRLFENVVLFLLSYSFGCFVGKKIKDND